MKKQPPPRERLSGILLCFFLSGAAGLIYQIAWAKALGLIFGHTAYAIATVLAVFMAGLAAGSAWLGRWGDRHSNPVALYAYIEFLIAATSALSLAGLAGVRALYLAIHPAANAAAPLMLAVRFFGTAVVLFIPTFLMGGTLPILVAGVVRNSQELGHRLSQLYWINTLGAVIGTLLAGFVLLPALGLRLTVVCAVLLNVIAGLIAFRIASAFVPLATTAAAPTRVLARNTQSSRADSQNAAPWLLLVLFAITGCTALVYEV